MNKLQVGTATAGPGEKGHGSIETLRLPNGQTVESPCVVVRGRQAGPTLYIGAGTHGDEINSIEMARETAEWLDPECISGSVIVVPVHNVPALLAGQRATPFDGLDLDSVYPGDPLGSASQRIAHAVFTQAVAKADAVLDLHTARSGARNLPYTYIPPKTTGARRRAEVLALKTGLPVLLRPPEKEGLTNRAGANLDHALFAVAGRKGIPALSMEFGEARRLEPDMVAIGVTAIRNVMIAMGILADRPGKIGRTLIASKVCAIRTASSGILRLEVDPGKWVKRDELIGVISDLTGRREEIRCPDDGVVIRLMVNAIAMPGDRVAVIAVNPRSAANASPVEPHHPRGTSVRLGRWQRRATTPHVS